MKAATAIQYQKKQEEAKFICSACGADRGCDCNAPAVEKLAEIVEQRRKARAVYNDKKRQQKQQTRDIPKGGGWSEKALDKALPDEMPTEEEADESYQETLYDQACLLLDSMADSTRQRFFAYLKRKYNVVTRQIA